MHGKRGKRKDNLRGQRIIYYWGKERGNNRISSKWEPIIPPVGKIKEGKGGRRIKTTRGKRKGQRFRRE